jgi:hypothetical protein
LGWTRWGGCRSALAGLLLLGACAPTLRVARPAPAVVDLGHRARVLSLVRVDGPGDSPEVGGPHAQGPRGAPGVLPDRGLGAGRAGGCERPAGLCLARRGRVELRLPAHRPRPGGAAGPGPPADPGLAHARGSLERAVRDGGLVEGPRAPPTCRSAGGRSSWWRRTCAPSTICCARSRPAPRIEEVELDVTVRSSSPGPPPRRAETSRKAGLVRVGARRPPRARRGVVRPGARARGARRLGARRGALRRRVSKKSDDRLYRDALETASRAAARALPPDSPP